MKHAGLVLGFVTGIIFSSRPASAQYTADFQTNIVSGMTSNWVDSGFNGGYLVGSNTFADVLLIQNSGTLSNNVGYLGYSIGSSNNVAVVDGGGSIWSNGNSLVVGYWGAGNNLLITNGGHVFSSS